MSEQPLFYKDELQKGTLYLLLCGFFAVIAILSRLDFIVVQKKRALIGPL